MMVSNLAAVENACRADRLITKRTAGIFEFACDCGDQLRQYLSHIIGKVPAVGTGISHQLLFIKALSVIQCLLSRKAENTVGVSLQARQVIQKWRLLQFFFRLNSFDHDFSGSLALLKDSFGVVFCRKTSAGHG